MAAVFLGGWTWSDGPTIHAPEDRQSDPNASFRFTVEGPLEKNVQFWVRVYTEVTTRQGYVHDVNYPERIYEVVELGDMTPREARQHIRSIKQKWQRALMEVHRKRKTPESMSDEEKRLFQMFSDVDGPDRFAKAAHRRRIRFQLGQKDRFLEALRDSGQYLPLMEEIFRKERMPWQLTRIPFVESGFSLRARSKVGASGVWQFMRGTGRLFLKINNAVDERNDPILATEAAAKFLRRNFEQLNSWPLAVVAYNHGPDGMARAVRKSGTNRLEEIVDLYRSPSFGFASKNFFMELLAALQVEQNAEAYFGKVQRAQPIEYVEVGVADYIAFKDLNDYLRIDRTELERLNPALLKAVYDGRQLIPAGFRLKLPVEWGKDSGGAREAFWIRYSEIPAKYKRRGQSDPGYGRKITSSSR